MNFDDYKGKDITNPDMESVNEIADQYSESDIKNLKNRVTADKVEDKVLKVKFKKESADETRYHLVLEDKILKLLTFLEFNMFTHVKNEYKKTYVNIIRDSLIDMYRNAAAYRLSRTISHIYAVDIEKEKIYALIQTLYTLHAAGKTNCISKDNLIIVYGKLNEIGKMCGGITKTRNEEKERLRKAGKKEKKPNPNMQVETKHTLKDEDDNFDYDSFNRNFESLFEYNNIKDKSMLYIDEDDGSVCPFRFVRKEEEKYISPFIIVKNNSN